MSKGIVTDYPEICFICGRPSEAEHHLVFGTAGRELSEKDGLKVPVCNNCHNMGEILMRIHGNPMAERMSKIGLGKGIRPAEGRRICANNRCGPKGRRSKADYSQGRQRDLPEEVRLFVFVGGNDENRNAKM